tara:strand:- start:2128 stop:3792 length:1665 start_codon:yes stop_codon:yes gene_type:complete
MLITLFFNIIICFVILGYSGLFKSIILNNKSISIDNLDFIYGIVFLALFSLLVNFFLPISFFKVFVIIIGLIFFVFFFFRKKFSINFIFLFFFLAIFSFFTYWNGNNADSPIYHIQTINWIHDYKVTFGLAILDWHYALNSIWHLILSLLSISYKNFNTLYTINFIPFAFLFNEIFSKYKKNSLSNFTLFSCTSFLIIFSFIHPYKNGIIFNHLGNPEVDTIGMIFFILSGIIFLRYLDSKNENEFKLLIVTSILCPLIKFNYIGAVLFPIFANFYLKRSIRTYFNLANFFSILLIFFWTIRNFIQSSCFLFPVKLTCYDTGWSLGSNQVQFYLNQTKSFSRDTPLRDKYLDFEYTIYSFDWFLPWFKNYFLEDAFLKISFSVLFISLFIYLILILKNFYLKKNLKDIKIVVYILLLFLLNIYIWFQAPEIRFGWGILIFFPCTIFAIIVSKLEILKKLNGNILSFFFLCLIFLPVIKNYSYFKKENLLDPFVKNFNYSKIVKISNSNGFEIYQSKNWMCGDFKGICINKRKKDYTINLKNNYLFISTTDRETN